MSSRGGCCGIAYDNLISLVQVGNGRPVYCRHSWGFRPHVMLVIVVSKGGRAPSSDVVMDTPKNLGSGTKMLDIMRNN